MTDRIEELEARVESRTQELERQTAVLRRIIDSIPDFIILKDTNSAYLGSNKAFEEFTGKPEQEQIGKTDYDLFDSNLAVTFRSLDRQILETGQTHSQEEWVTYPDGRQALRALEEDDPALILLDVGLPDIDGFSLCSRIREVSHAPIIMLTARHHDEDVVRGFKAGAERPRLRCESSTRRTRRRRMRRSSVARTRSNRC